MEISSNNRYELLYMEDDCVGSPEQATTAVSVLTKKPIITAKKSFEKENKSSALNKNDAENKTPRVQSKTKTGTAPESSLNNSRAVEKELRSVSFKSKNKVGEQRNKRNPNGDFGCEQREPRQFRERDNKSLPRNRGGKREFDRQSGSDKTGVKAIEKRDGAGAHNWGSVKQQIDDINKSTNEADATLTDKDESSNEQILEQPAATDEDVKELTLDEWKALRGERAKPQYNIRKPNEGEDTSQWKKMVVLNKKKEGDDSEEEYEYDPSMYPQRVGRLQRIVDIQFNFNDGRRGGGGLSRGRGRGLRPGIDKGNRSEGVSQQRQRRNIVSRQRKPSSPNALKVDDESQFPTLS